MRVLGGDTAANMFGKINHYLNCLINDNLLSIKINENILIEKYGHKTIRINISEHSVDKKYKVGSSLYLKDCNNITELIEFKKAIQNILNKIEKESGGC